MDIKTYEELKAINEALSPEERKAKRKARRDGKKTGVVNKKTGKAGDDDDEIEDNWNKHNSDDDDMDIEKMDVKPSKSMAQAVERFRQEQVKFQDLQKEFVLTPKDKIAKRESLKKQLVVQSKKARAAEKEFERMVASEEDEFVDDLFFESIDMTELLNESISSSTVSAMDKIAAKNTKVNKAFLIAADAIMELLYRDNDFDYEDVLEYLAIKMESMHPSD